mmetsp:Transcript_2277/g.15162  ORF Transcript_2277/g.15162 Transcript_2277/m.15162 type:complete len:256 (-) Transcript_2277:52-819(-)
MSAASCTVEIFSAPSSSRVMSNCSSRAIMISTWIQSIDCSGKVSSIHTSPSAGHFFSQSAGLSFVSYRVEGIGPEVDEFGGRADRLHIGSELLCNDRLHLLQGIRRLGLVHGRSLRVSVSTRRVFVGPLGFGNCKVRFKRTAAATIATRLARTARAWLRTTTRLPAKLLVLSCTSSSRSFPSSVRWFTSRPPFDLIRFHRPFSSTWDPSAIPRSFHPPVRVQWLCRSSPFRLGASRSAVVRRSSRWSCRGFVPHH